MGSLWGTGRLRLEHEAWSCHHLLSSLLPLLALAVLSSQGASAKSQILTVRFGGYVPYSCPQKQSKQVIDGTGKQTGSFRYISQEITGGYQQMTCVFY
ncbi:hypothetical protein OAE57_01740 [Synechococcus sp. AH-551-C10]|nr:hypothetical protein [Synechococcus sp. AH-551-C10]|tara:strand:+ start:182 stop:475 length:294 start_codon:yes stop_codon:yes gene_type:complete